MEETKGYYSIIQYCPDFSRHEMVNVGVILLVPEKHFVAARTSGTNSRARKVFGQGSFDPARLNFAKSSIEKRLQIDKDRLIKLEEFERFADARGNDLVITKPRPVRLAEPEQELDHLFSELVKHREGRKKQPVFPLLDKALRDLRFEKRIEYNKHVDVPIVGRKLQIPYAFRNGTYNLLKPQLFTHDAMLVGMQLAVEGDLVQSCSGNGVDRKLIVIPKIEGASRPQKARQALAGLFQRYGIRTVWEDEFENFTTEVDREARPIAE
jgi:hypothetical protein